MRMEWNEDEKRKMKNKEKAYIKTKKEQNYDGHCALLADLLTLNFSIWTVVLWALKVRTQQPSVKCVALFYHF